MIRSMSSSGNLASISCHRPDHYDAMVSGLTPLVECDSKGSSLNIGQLTARAEREDYKAFLGHGPTNNLRKPDFRRVGVLPKTFKIYMSK